MKSASVRRGSPKPMRRLRRASTDAERKLWARLQAGQIAGAKFRRQHRIGSYITDFVCIESRLIVEADGSQHADSPKDLVRTQFLESRGYRVLRFWNTEILLNIDGVLATISQSLAPS